MQRSSVIFITGTAALILIIAALLMTFRTGGSDNAAPDAAPAAAGALAPQTEGVLKGTDSYNLPGTAYPTRPPAGTRSPAVIAPEPPTACTMEARQCPDGSYVGRTGPQCAFAPCPGN